MRRRSGAGRCRRQESAISNQQSSDRVSRSRDDDVGPITLVLISATYLDPRRCQYTFWSGKSFQVEPRVGFQYIRVDFDGFTEEGARVLNLETSARSVSSQRSILGARAARMVASSTTVEMRAAWAHEFSPLGSMRMRLVGDTGDNAFDVTSPAQIHNSAVVGGSLVGKAFKRVKFVTSVDGDLSSVIKLWNASIGLRAEW
jgi:outer membrane autotransporter protein